MISLKNQILKFFGITLLAFSVISIPYFKYLLTDIKESVEEKSRTETNQLIENYIKKEIENLHHIVLDWSSWKDTTSYIKGEDPNYYKDNINSETMTNLGVNYNSIVIKKDNEFNLLHSFPNGISKSDTEVIDSFIIQEFKDSPEEISGIIKVNDSFMIISSNRVKSYESNEYEFDAYLFFTRTINNDFIDPITKALNLKLISNMNEVRSDEYTYNNYHFLTLNNEDYYTLNIKKARTITPLLSRMMKTSFVLNYIFIATLLYFLFMFISKKLILPINILSEKISNIEDQSIDHKINTDTSVYEIHLLNKSIEKFLTVLRESNRHLLESSYTESIGAVARGIAHQISNPLTGAKLLLRRARKSDDKDVVLNALQRIEDSHQRIEDILKSISLLNNNVGKDPIKHSTVELLANIELITRSNISEDVILIVTSKGEQPDNFYFGYFHQIYLALIKVIENANTALEEVQGKKELKIEVMIKGDELKISTNNNGPVIEKGVLEKMFLPLYSSDMKNQGLGLNIATQVLSNVGYKISFKEQSQTFEIDAKLKIIK